MQRSRYVIQDNDGKTTEIKYDEITKSNEISMGSENISSTNVINDKSFKIGEDVMYKNSNGRLYEGKIVGLNSNTAICESTKSSGKIIKREVPVDQLIKIKSKNEQTEKINELNVSNDTIISNINNQNVLEIENEVYSVTTDALNVRSGPGSNYDIIDKINKGSEVEIIEKVNSEWWRIKYNSKSGYVSSKYLSR